MFLYILTNKSDFFLNDLSIISPIIHDIHELNKYSEDIKLINSNTCQSRCPTCLKEKQITTMFSTKMQSILWHSESCWFSKMSVQSSYPPF